MDGGRRVVLGFAGAPGEKHSGDGEGWTVQTFSSVRMQCRTAGWRGGGQAQISGFCADK